MDYWIGDADSDVFCHQFRIFRQPDYYTAELTREDASFRNILIIMSVTAVTLVTAVIIEDVSRYIFSAFVVKTQNEVKHDIYKSVVNTKYSLLNNADRGSSTPTTTATLK